MEAMPQLESCLRLSFEARDGQQHPSGVLLASYFVRAPTRGRRRTELDPDGLFPPAVLARLGPAPDRVIALAMDSATYRSCDRPIPTIPVATRTTPPPQLDAKQQAAFMEKAKALAPKYRTEFLAKA